MLLTEFDEEAFACRGEGACRESGEAAEEDSINLLVELSQELGTSKDAAVQGLMDKKGLNWEEALKKVEIYWKDSSNLSL